MKTIKGPAIFLAQFMGDAPPFNSLRAICQWAKSLGFVGVQIPTWDSRCIDLQKAAESKTYADELKGIINECGLQITELSTHLQGQLVAVNPAYDTLFDAFAPANLHNTPQRERPGRYSSLNMQPKPRKTWDSMHMLLLAVHYYGPRYIPGHNAPPDW